MNIDTHIFTYLGGRNVNEDCAKYNVDKDKGLFVLSDGLGGLINGDKASAFVVENLIQAWNDDHEIENLKIWLEENITSANDLLVEKQQEMKCKMKSTVVVLAVDENKAAWANLGDSRLYYVSDGCLRFVTKDHSVSYMKYLSGEITYDNIRFDEDQSSLLKCVGDKNGCSPDVVENSQDLKDGDGFMLCSDGVWKYLYKNEILIDCLKSDTAEEWAKLMLLRIMARIEEKCDNLTLMTVKLKNDF